METSVGIKINRSIKFELVKWKDDKIPNKLIKLLCNYSK